MARLLFEMQGIRQRRGAPATGVVFVVYTNEAGTVLADISATSGASATSTATVVAATSTVTTTDIAGLGPASVRFYGPDDVKTLYLRCPADPLLGVQELEADENERLGALEAGGVGGSHPNLAVHDALGLATDAELTTHAADTTAVHGITDTTVLATTSGVASSIITHAAAADPHADRAYARAYADSVAQGLDVKLSVRVASTANLTLSGEQTIDGVLTSADRVLVKNQTAGATNGIYVSAAGAWTRATDADISAELSPGSFTFVEEGTVNGGTGWVQATPDPVVLDTTALVFTQFSGGGTIIGGAGLLKTGSTLDVGAGTGITVAADTVGIAAGGVTNTQVNAAAGIAESKLALNFPTHAESHASRHAAAGADPLTGYVPATIFDAKGDLLSASAADTSARLAVGTAGQVLAVDSAAATGLRWGTLPEIDVTAAPYSVVVGAADSSTGMQAAIDAGETTGRALRLPAGTINCNVQVGDSVTMFGAGRLKTILKSVAGSNIDVIKGKHFAALDDTNPATPETAGDNALNLFDLCIDGNKASNGQGFGIRIWGVGHVWHNIIVQNCAQDGIRTEFAREVSTFSGGWGVLEGDFRGIHTIHNNGNGWTFMGPHDSWLSEFVTYGNTFCGLESLTSNPNYDGVMHGTNWNSFLNGAGSYKFAASFNLGFVIASAADVGIGVDIQPGVSNSSIKHLLVGGHTTGLMLRGQGHHIGGTFETCSTTAVDFNATIGCILDIAVDHCEKVFTFTSDQGYHKIRASVHLVAPQTLKSGTVGPGNSIDVKDSGGVESLWQMPAGTFLGLVAAEKVLIVKGAGSQSANLQEWQNSGGTAVASISAGGALSAPSVEPISTPGTGAYLALNSNIAQVVQRSNGVVVLQVTGASGQTGNLLNFHNGTGVVGSVTAEGKHAFVAANEATTVGAAGAASAPPITPTKYFLVKDSAGVTLKIPAYAS